MDALMLDMVVFGSTWGKGHPSPLFREVVPPFRSRTKSDTTSARVSVGVLSDLDPPPRLF